MAENCTKLEEEKAFLQNKLKACNDSARQHFREMREQKRQIASLSQDLEDKTAANNDLQNKNECLLEKMENQIEKLEDQAES